MTFTLVVPTLNEIHGMKEIMPRVKKEWFDQILILDGGSKDGTVEYALEQGYEVHHQKNRGLRKGLIEAFEKVRGDVMITFSPDGNSIPEILPDLIAKMEEGYDMVIVSRYKDGAKSLDDTFLTRIGNWAFTALISCFGFRYTDAMVIYRAYKRSMVEELGIPKLRSKFYEKHVGRFVSWEPQLSIRAAKQRKKIAEIPGDEPRRVDGFEVDIGTGMFLPNSRIRHFRVGFACLCLIADEMFRRTY